MKYIIFSMLLILMMVEAHNSAMEQNQRAYIQLSKKRCLGKCPVYDLLIYTNGVVVYNGIDHVTDMGKRQFEISDAKLNEIKTLLDDLDFESLKNHIQKKARDLPVTDLIIDGEKLSFQGQNIPKQIKKIITVLEALI